MKTKSTMLFIRSRQLMLFLGICLFVVPVFGQVTDAKKFASVPAPIRERLIERLSLYLEYDRTNQQEKKYDLFSEYTKTVSWKTKAEYIKFLQDQEAKGAKRTFVAFDISSVEDYSLDDSDYRIFHIKGVVKFKRGSKLKKENLLLDARYENGEWYFSDWLKEEVVID
jgi:hypothetical protein